MLATRSRTKPLFLCVHQLDEYRNPDLNLHRIGTCAVVMLDAQMSFDPAEEKLDTPSRLTSLGMHEQHHLTFRRV